ncbi:uncharacterized protein TRIADDRAFT_11807, partial [Trichoplax adhaerens]
SSQRQNHKLTTYERVSKGLPDEKINREITLGKRISHYKLRGELGNGNFSQVKLGIHDLTNDRAAVKILDKTKLDDKTRKLLSCEVDAMDRLHHPNVIRLYEVVETIERFYLIIEYASGGELYTYISKGGRMKEEEAKPLFAQIVSAIEHIHQNDIVHRDVKAENILFSSNNKQVKVADFGFSTFAKATTKLNTFCGSPPYAAPELFKDDYYYGPLVDIWALGVLLYFMVVGTMPFRAETVDKLKDCILEGRYVFPSFVSQDCKILITSILRHNPRERYSIREIIESSFLEQIEFPKPYPPCKNTPTFHHGDDQDFESMQEIEETANKQLRQLGITKEMYDKGDHKDYRNNVTGTYRIILFGMQRR